MNELMMGAVVSSLFWLIFCWVYVRRSIRDKQENSEMWKKAYYKKDKELGDCQRTNAVTNRECERMMEELRILRGFKCKYDKLQKWLEKCPELPTVHETHLIDLSKWSSVWHTDCQKKDGE
jgi:hypothetical protein